MTININELTLGQVKELQALLGGTSATQPTINNAGGFWKIGEAYLVRTVTMITIGRLVAFDNQELVFSSASWIADTGRFHDALLKGDSIIKEVEPFIDDSLVPRGCIVDATKWRHKLDIGQK